MKTRDELPREVIKLIDHLVDALGIDRARAAITRALALPLCEQRHCIATATREVFWPGKTTRQCALHTEALRSLAAAMGFELDDRILS